MLKTLTESLHKLMNISLQPSPLIKAIKPNVKELWDKFSRNKQSLTTISENDKEPPQPFKLPPTILPPPATTPQANVHHTIASQGAAPQEAAPMEGVLLPVPSVQKPPSRLQWPKLPSPKRRSARLKQLKEKYGDKRPLSETGYEEDEPPQKKRIRRGGFPQERKLSAAMLDNIAPLEAEDEERRKRQPEDTLSRPNE